MHPRLHRTAAAWLAALLGMAAAHAAVTPEEAARLKTELTPFGAEKAGNKDGSIPAWTGGYSTPIPATSRVDGAATRSRTTSRCIR